MPFQLNPRLAAGGHDFGTHGICRVLLKNNALFPWIILVPEVDEFITEIHELDADDYLSICETSRIISQFLDTHFQPEKINVATIGNIVRQMHIHIVARTESDPAWPGVVWSCSEKRPYTENEVETIHTAYSNFMFENVLSD